MADTEEQYLEETDGGDMKCTEKNGQPQSLTRHRKRRKLNSSKRGQSEPVIDLITSLRNGSSSVPDLCTTGPPVEPTSPESVASEADADLYDGQQSDSSASKPDLSYEKGVKKFVCALCGAAFTSNSYLTVHKRTHSGEKPYRCQYPDCSAAFTAAGSLRRHENTHTKARRYVCQDCGDSFTQSSSLNTHRRKHTGYRPFHCDLCPRTFVSSSHLKKHQLMHSGEKPHVCQECGAQFSNSHNLKRHLMIHSGERPFMCRECGDVFITNDDLKRHVQTHSVHKQFTCPYCPAAFSRAGRLRKHELKHASGVSEKTRAGEGSPGFTGETGEGGEEQLSCEEVPNNRDHFQHHHGKHEHSVVPELSIPCSHDQTDAAGLTSLPAEDSGSSKVISSEEESDDSDCQKHLDVSDSDDPLAAGTTPTETH